MARGVLMNSCIEYYMIKIEAHQNLGMKDSEVYLSPYLRISSIHGGAACINDEYLAIDFMKLANDKLVKRYGSEGFMLELVKCGLCRSNATFLKSKQEEQFENKLEMHSFIVKQMVAKK